MNYKLFKRHLRGALRSLTIWVNGLFLAALPAIELLNEALPELRNCLTEETYKKVGLGLVIVNILLRVRTTGALSDKVDDHKGG